MRTAENVMMLTYDIPTAVRVPGVCRKLERAGFVRVNLSVWIGTMSAFALLPVREWRAAGVNVQHVQFAECEWDNLRAMAVQALERDVRLLVQHVKKQIAKTAGMYAEAERLQSAADVKKACSWSRGVMRTVRHRLQSAEQSALLFGLLAETDQLIESAREAGAAYQSMFAVRHERALESVNPQQEVAL